MKKIILQRIAILGVVISVVLPLQGCEVLTAVADSKQKPPETQYTSKQRPDRVFTAAVQSMGVFGKVLSQDRVSGVVQGQKGNWVMNATIAQYSKGSQVQLAARYVPSQQMDFNSRDEMTKEFVLLEKNIGSQLTGTKAQP